MIAQCYNMFYVAAAKAEEENLLPLQEQGGKET